MEIVIRHTPGCPNAGTAVERVREALTAEGLEPTQVRLEVVPTPEEAERLGFQGSPSILVDGSDPFATPGAAPAFACRNYGPSRGAAPTVEAIRAALVERRRQ